MRTLIVAPNWIGDAVMAQPLVALLSRSDPDGTIDALAPPHIAPVLRAMPGIREVIEFANQHGRLDMSGRWRIARRLAAQRHDRAFVLPNSLKSAIVPFLAGIRQRIGWRGEARHLLLNVLHDDREAGKQRPPMVEHYAQLAMPPGRSLPGPLPNPSLRIEPRRVRDTLARLGLEDAPLVVLAPGAEYGPAKRWPARHFAALANMVADEWPEAAIVLLGSAKERCLATEIAALSGLPLRNLCGETSLDEAIALISHAAGVVSNDSGLMHVAAALGRPQVALFGSTDPRHTPPRSTRARVQWLHLECSPCFARDCPLGHTNCLNDLAPAGAFSALRQTMQLETAARR